MRGGEAARRHGVFDSSDEIERRDGIGLGWPSVGTCADPPNNDHAGSIAVIKQKAPAATAYAGSEDIPGLGGVDMTAVGDGDQVFGRRS